MNFKLLTRAWLFVAALLSANLVLADSPVWKVVKDGRVHYLGGTIHVLKPSDYPLPAVFDRAYDLADTIVFETDVLDMASVAREAARMLRYPADEALFDHLDDATQARLSQWLDAHNIPASMVSRFKPGALLISLVSEELKRLGVTSRGVDHHFAERALADDKIVVALETPAHQIGFLAQLGEGNENRFVNYILDDMALLDSQFDDIRLAWRGGDPDTLIEASGIDRLQRDFPQFYQTLLVQRNNRWLPQLLALFDSGDSSNDLSAGSSLVLVGALHLVGEDGLINLLQSRGYRIEPFKTD